MNYKAVIQELEDFESMYQIDIIDAETDRVVCSITSDDQFSVHPFYEGWFSDIAYCINLNLKVQSVEMR